MPEQVEKTVFISYRRANSAHARAVHQALIARGYDVFLDFENIPAGDFEQIILAEIDARAHFVLLLTPSALERCINPDDVMRWEIERAIDTRRNIIALIFDGFRFENATPHLADKLALLPKYNAVDVPWSYFDEAMTRLDERFLRVPLDLVMHPTSIEGVKAAQTITTPSDDQLHAEEYYERGVIAYERGQIAAAISDFSKALLFQEDFAEAYYRRGRAHRVDGQTDSAIDDLNQAVEYARDDLQRHLYRSTLNRFRRAFTDALNDATAALALAPNDPDLHANRGAIHYEQSNLAAAITDFSNAIDIHPNFALAYNSRGMAHADNGDYLAAIADYDAAIRLMPQLAAVYNNRGVAQGKRGDWDAAIRDYETALEIDPAHGPAAHNLRAARWQKNRK